MIQIKKALSICMIISIEQGRLGYERTLYQMPPIFSTVPIFFFHYYEMILTKNAVDYDLKTKIVNNIIFYEQLTLDEKLT